MATTALGTALHNLRRSMVVQEDPGLTDGELLECFVSQRDEAAFEVLLRRHGAMVLGVCRRILRNEADAEDAFQATFLVLVRKAGSIRPRGMVGNWLYGVAHSTALKARAMKTKQASRERAAAARPRPDDAAQTLEQLTALLDRELKALPDKYRAVIVLCDLEGRSIKEAARQLGCPQGTIGTRLVRGRSLLSRRLTRRGVALPAGVLATAIAQQVASAGVPPLLMHTTAKAAAQFAAGRSAAANLISTRVSTLTERVLKAMFLAKLKIAAAGLLLAFIAAALVVVATAPTHVAEAAPRTPPVMTQDRAIPGEANLQPPGKPVAVQEEAHIRTVAWSANGKLVATIGIIFEFVDFTDERGNPIGKGGIIPNSTVKLWNATTGKLELSLGEQKNTYAAAIAFSPDGKTAAISLSKHIFTKRADDPISYETEVRVIDTKTWEIKHKVKMEGFASALSFSPDGNRLALGGRSRLADDAAFVRLWDGHQEKMIGGTEGGGYRVSCLAFSKDGKLLATGDENGKVRVFDGLTGAALREFEGQGDLRSGGEQCVIGVGLSPDGKTLVSGRADKAVKLWDLQTGKLARELKGNILQVSVLAFSPDGKHFATAGALQRDGKCESVEILVWDLESGTSKKIDVDQDLPVTSLAFAPDGSTLAIGAGNTVYGRSDPATGRAQTSGRFTVWKLK
jgi:RNA polymerase sigma factor (sigma-70 family)